MRSSMSTPAPSADRRRAANKFSVSLMRQGYMKEGKADTRTDSVIRRLRMPLGAIRGATALKRWSRTPARRQHDDGRAWLHPIEEIDDVGIVHADAAGRNGLADIFGLVGAVDAVERVLVALVEIERPRTQRVRRASGNALGIGTEPRLNLRRRNPVRPFSGAANRGDTGKGQRFFAY